MRIAAKVTPGESRVAKSNASAERFTFTVKKSDVTNGEAEGATGGKPTPKSSILNVNQEEIEDFAAVRAQIFPVLKARSWVDVTQDLLTKIDPKNKAGVLYAPLKSVPGSDIGYTLAIIRDQPDSLSYILTSHLEAWATSESVLQKVAIGNLEKKFDEFGDDLWIRSKTGIYYINTSLRSLSASVILLPRFIERLDVESGDPVVVVPSSDLCMVAGSKMETRLCIVGEMSLRYSSDPHHLNTSLRLNKARMIMAKYSPKSFAGEFPIPSTAEEVAGLKLRVQQFSKPCSLTLAPCRSAPNRSCPQMERSPGNEMQLLRRTVEDGFSKQLTILNDLRIQGIHREPRLQRPTFAHSNTETEVTMHHWDVPQHLEGDVRPSLFSQNAVSINHSIFKSDIVSVDDSAEVLEPEVAMAPDPSVGWMATLSPNPASALEVPLEEDEGNQVDATQSSQLKRYFKKKRDSSRHSFVRRALGAHQERANKEASRLAKLRAKTDAKTNPKSAWRMKLDEITSSNAFSNAIMLVIMVNVVLLGVEVDVSTQLGQNDVPRWFGSVNTVIVAIFCVEIVVKCVAQGLQEYWCGTEAAWNIMDAVIIVVSLVETAIDIWAQAMASDNGSVTSSSQLRLVRSIRLARALRGVRVVRLFRYVSALRTLALCIVSTVGSLLWTLVLLFYTFGVLLTQLVTDHCRDRNILEQEDANATPSCPKEFYYWRTVPDSMLTLFMSIAGGLSWEDALTPLRGVSALAVIFMVIFIVITVFAVLNVVTGVFCNTAIESANADKDIAVIKQLQKQASHVEALRKIFEVIDADSLDVVSIQDLEEAMSQKKLSSFLESMGISTEDVWTLFMIMDNDQTGLVNLEEFVSGCLQGQGPAKSIQLVKMSYENKVTRQALKKVGIEIRGVMTDLSDLRLRMGLQASILPQTGRDSFSMGANSGAEVPTSAGNL